MADPELPDTLLPPVPSLPPLLQLAQRLEQAWQATAPGAPPPNLLSYLPPPSDPQRLAALQELVRVDLNMRWRRGLGTLLESYLHEFPELAETSSLPPELIYHEYCVRWQHGDRPLLADYQQRFPSQYPSLLRMSQGNSSQAEANARGSKRPINSTPFKKTIPPDAEDSLVWNSQPSVPEAASPPPSPEAGDKSRQSLPKLSRPSDQSKNLVPLVGGYRLLRRLGRGALGEVWLAEAPGGVEVAVKRLFKTLEAYEAQCELQSLEHVKRLRHNHLIAIHAFWIHKGRLHVAMELSDSNLCDRAKEYQKQGLPGIPQEELLRYVREAAEALDFLHSEGIQHRDIKPANILLLKGHVKVADFGLVRMMPDTQTIVQATSCGTYLYMPPEVWEGNLSIHSDQWSLASSYVELRLNRKVFKSKSIPSLMDEIRTAKLDLTPLAAAEQRVLRKALHPNPRQRYASCTAFAQALDAVFHPPPAPPPRRWLLLTISLSIALAAAVLLFAVLYRFWVPPPAGPSLPPSCEAIGTEIEKDDNSKEYYKQVLYRLNDKISVEFVLIPKKAEHWKSEHTDVPTFYISRFKISREQFAWFAKQYREKVKNDEWMKYRDDGDTMPVRDVTVTDAHAFAERLGGLLPSRLQWDKAAGLYHPSLGSDPYWEGPYRGRWKGKGSLGIAIDLNKPLSLGSPQTEDDVSVYGCRDMAGNGSEWTRTTLLEGKEVPLKQVFGLPEESVYLRGWGFDQESPLIFKELEQEEANRQSSRAAPYTSKSFDRGFRVVLESSR